jgi:hypothetical protein
MLFKDKNSATLSTTNIAQTSPEANTDLQGENLRTGHQFDYRNAFQKNSSLNVVYQGKRPCNLSATVNLCHNFVKVCAVWVIELTPTCCFSEDHHHHHHHHGLLNMTLQ